MFKFLILFLVLVSLLFSLEFYQGVQERIVEPFTSGLAWFSGLIISIFDDDVISYGRVIKNTSNLFAIKIEAGCNGVEAAIVLFSAIMAFPAKLIQKLIAVILGLFSIQILNIIRIISLFYLGQWNMSIFSWFHLYLWPVLIMLDVVLVFLIFINFLGREN